MDATTPDSRGTRHPRHWAGRWLCGPAARLSSVLTLMGFIAACQAAPTAPPPTPSPTPGDPVGLSLRQPADIDQVIASGEWDVRVSDVQLGVSAYRLAQQKIGAIDTARLGAVFGLDTGTTGTHYFDAFEDRRVPTTIGAETSLPDQIFTNSFESNSLANWVVYGAGITTTTAANLAPGQSIGAAVAVTSTQTTRYLEDLTPNRESRYRARVYFDPNGLTMAVNNSFNLLNIYTGTTEIWRLEFQYVATGYRLRGAVRNDASLYTTTGWTTLTDSAHVLEIDWRAATGPGANNGGLTLWIDGAQVGALTAVDNDTRRVDKANIGAVGLDAGTTGTFYLDAFESRRESAIGPVQVAGSALTTTAIAYGYDPLYRLTSATYSDGTLFGYQYDAVGNVLTKTQTISGTPTLQTYAYDDANRQTSAAGLAQTYDNNGNLTHDGATAYTWDGANRMAASGSTAYSYNGLNDRVSAGGVTHQLDLNAGLAQVLADGTNTYLYGAGRLGEQQGAAWQYHLADGLGSVRQLADASGAVSAARSYEPYGEVLSSAGMASSAYGFTGEQQDSSGKLVYLRARYYQSEAMRFASRDTWAGDMGRPIGYNKWGYVTGDPVNAIDPSGLKGYRLWNSYEKILRSRGIEIASSRLSREAIYAIVLNFAGNPDAGTTQNGKLVAMSRVTDLRIYCDDKPSVATWVRNRISDSTTPAISLNQYDYLYSGWVDYWAWLARRNNRQVILRDPNILKSLATAESGGGNLPLIARDPSDALNRQSLMNLIGASGYYEVVNGTADEDRIVRQYDLVWGQMEVTHNDRFIPSLEVGITARTLYAMYHKATRIGQSLRGAPDSEIWRSVLGGYQRKDAGAVSCFGDLVWTLAKTGIYRGRCNGSQVSDYVTVDFRPPKSRPGSGRR